MINSSTQSIYIYNKMKKNKRVGNRTDVNFFISDFKLKSTQLFRNPRQRKTSNKGNHQRYHNLFRDSRKSQRQISNNKPQIEQLHFASATSTNYFKSSRSLSKRSSSKVYENEKSRLEKINNDMYSYIHGGIQTNKDAEGSRMNVTEGRFKHRILKTSSVNQNLKDKLEKSALQKFHQAVTRQEQVAHQGACEKKAQALFKFLREARMRHENRGKKYTYQQTELSEDRNCQTGPGFFKHSQTSRQFDYQPSQPAQDFKQPPPKSNKNIVYQQLIASRHPPLPKDKKNHHESIHRERFDDNNNNGSELSGSQVDFGQIDSSQEDINERKPGAKNKPEPVIPQTHTKAAKISEKIIQEQKRNYQPKPPPQVKISEKAIREQSNKIQQQLPLDSIIKKEIQQKKQYQNDLLDLLPEVSTKSPKKVKRQKQEKKQPPRDSQKQLSVNQSAVEKVLTSQYLEKNNSKELQKRLKTQKEQKKAKVLGAPPTLNNQTPKNNNKINYRPVEADIYEIQEVQFVGNQLRQVAKKAQPTKNNPQHEIKQQLPQAPRPPTKNPQPTQKHDELPPPTQQNVEKMQQSEGDALDALIFYIQRIEDIGQYRMKSKDVYSDKSISKQLLEINKICSYYMAHQFLYLTKQLHSLLTAPKITKDYYEILTSDLQQLREAQQIDQDISTLEQNMQQSKKLLQKCYKDAKDSLPNEERILLLDGGINYQLKCCRMILKQFRIIYTFYEKKKDSEMIKKRCCYLIEIFCVLKMFAGEQIKEAQEIDDIQDYDQHIKQYKALLLGS